ncbi:hypothetical protein SAMN02910456_01191 [Ruminococcaceae bacterium YRB3002]|nr:hypothetical protein SAMN02910456_01191 [Ruminococcaceae bacterium YRB3002]
MGKVGRPSKEDAKRKVLSVRLSPETYKKLQDYASANNKSMSDAVLSGLEEFLEKNNAN